MKAVGRSPSYSDVKSPNWIPIGLSCVHPLPAGSWVVFGVSGLRPLGSSVYRAKGVKSSDIRAWIVRRMLSVSQSRVKVLSTTLQGMLSHLKPSPRAPVT